MPTVDFTWLFIKMMVVLIVICVAAVLVLKYAIPRWGFLQKMAKGRLIRVLSRTSLGTRQQAWVIGVGSRYFLVGTGPSGLSCLAELSAKDVEEHNNQ